MSINGNRRNKVYYLLADYQKKAWGIGKVKVRKCLGYPEENSECAKAISSIPRSRICASCHEYAKGLAESGTYEPPRKAIMHKFKDSQRAFEDDSSVNLRERQRRA